MVELWGLYQKNLTPQESSTCGIQAPTGCTGRVILKFNVGATVFANYKWTSFRRCAEHDITRQRALNVFHQKCLSLVRFNWGGGGGGGTRAFDCCNSYGKMLSCIHKFCANVCRSTTWRWRGRLTRSRWNNFIRRSKRIPQRQGQAHTEIFWNFTDTFCVHHVSAKNCLRLLWQILAISAKFLNPSKARVCVRLVQKFGRHSTFAWKTLNLLIILSQIKRDSSRAIALPACFKKTHVTYNLLPLVDITHSLFPCTF